MSTGQNRHDHGNNRGLIIETDLGRDPDDLWALLYLLSAGQKILAVLVSPGDPDQLAVAHFIREELNCNFKIGASRIDSGKMSCRGQYHQLFLDRYGSPHHAEPDGLGSDIAEEAFSANPESELVVIGPLSNVGEHIRQSDGFWCSRATMQGGFIGYDVHGKAAMQVEKFIGKQRVQTFNLNASGDLAFDFLNANIDARYFIGKHICHGVIYDQAIHERVLGTPPSNRAAELFREAMAMYLELHPQGKKFHDPIAAACHLHPEIAEWVRASLYKVKGEWGANLDESGDHVAINVDIDGFWEYIASGQ